jgi:hypothetical protein
VLKGIVLRDEYFL